MLALHWVWMRNLSSISRTVGPGCSVMQGCQAFQLYSHDLQSYKHGPGERVMPLS